MTDADLVSIGLKRPGGAATGVRLSLLLDSGFRPFFLLAGAYACAPLLYWLVLYGDGVAFVGEWPAARWHAHEMVHGFAGAGIAGFLTTAVPKWTSRPAPSRATVGMLVSAWLIARAAAWMHGALPGVLVAGAAALFWGALLAVIGWPIVAARNRRNYGFLALLGGLALAAAGTPIDPAGSIGRAAAGVGVALVALLVATVGGRIVPAFTYGALERAGVGVHRRAWRPVRIGYLILMALGLGADLVFDARGLGGALTMVAGGLVLANLAAWYPHRTLREPIVWALHVAWIWLGGGLILRGAARALGALDPLLGLHALTVGAFGVMLLAVMSRATLGHTGRRLAVGAPLAVAYALAALAALVRVGGPLVWPSARATTVRVAGAMWIAAYLIFLVRLAPALLRPRVDGRPG